MAVPAATYARQTSVLLPAEYNKVSAAYTGKKGMKAVVFISKKHARIRVQMAHFYLLLSSLPPPLSSLVILTWEGMIRLMSLQKQGLAYYG
jgi:hypothetical protein